MKLINRYLDEETLETKPVGLDDLKFIATSLMDVAIQELKETNGFTASAGMILADRSVDVAPLDGNFFTTPYAKRMLMHALKSVCKQTGAVAIVMVTDGWTLDQTPEQKERTKDGKFLEIAKKGGTMAAAAAGYGTLMEVITVMGQTRTCVYIQHQMYQRMAADGVIPGTAVYAGDVPEHTIRLYGDRTETGDGANFDALSGRMMRILYEGNDDES